ncbi:MAG: cupin domain-containing protein [Chthoniobacterales bacterium]
MNTASYWFLGSRLTILADSGDTDGRYDLIEGWFPAGMQTPLHRHTRYQEQLFVIEGEFTVRVGKSILVLTPGQTAIIPMGEAHCIAATGGGPARGLVVAPPSGFARVISGSAVPDINGQPVAKEANMALFTQLSKEVGDEILGPPGTYPDGEMDAN